MDRDERPREELIVVAGHNRHPSCNPYDSRFQQWFPALSRRHAEALAADLRDGTLKMRCPACEKNVRAYYIDIRD